MGSGRTEDSLTSQQTPDNPRQFMRNGNNALVQSSTLNNLRHEWPASPRVVAGDSFSDFYFGQLGGDIRCLGGRSSPVTDRISWFERLGRR